MTDGLLMTAKTQAGETHHADNHGEDMRPRCCGVLDEDTTVGSFATRSIQSTLNGEGPLSAQSAQRKLPVKPLRAGTRLRTSRHPWRLRCCRRLILDRHADRARRRRVFLHAVAKFPKNPPPRRQARF